jgi:hypothetical protein
MDFNTSGSSAPGDTVPPVVQPTPQDEFKTQFGSNQPPVAEAPAVDIPSVVPPSFNSTPTVEVAPSKEDPQAVFVREVKAAVEKLDQAKTSK